MNVRDTTVQFNDITYISDAIGIALFHCFIKCFICSLQEGAYGTGMYGTQSTMTLCVL